MPAPKFIDDPAFRDLRDNDIAHFEEHTAGRKQVDFSNADLRGVDLRNVDVNKLIFATRTSATPTCAGLDLRGLDMEGCSLHGAKISGTYFPADLIAARNRQQRAVRYPDADQRVERIRRWLRISSLEDSRTGDAICGPASISRLGSGLTPSLPCCKCGPQKTSTLQLRDTVADRPEALTFVSARDLLKSRTLDCAACNAYIFFHDDRDFKIDLKSATLTLLFPFHA